MTTLETWTQRGLGGFVGAVGVAMLSMPAATMAEQDAHTVADLAPASTFVLWGTDNWAEMETAFMDSHLGQLWNEDSVQQLVRVIREDLEDEEEFQDFQDEMADLGVEWDQIGFPKGTAGMAVYFGDSEVEGATGEFLPQIFIMADYGDRAADIEQIAQNVFDNLSDDDKLSYDVDTYRQLTVHTLGDPLAEEEEEEEEEEDAPQTDWDDEWHYEEPTPPFSQLHIIRHDGLIMACTNLDQLHRIVDATFGDRYEALAQTEDYANVRSQHPDNTHAYLYGIFSKNLRDAVNDQLRGAASMIMEGEADLDPLGTLGFNQLSGGGYTVAFNTATATAEAHTGIYTPTKDGLLSLLDTAMDSSIPPAFINSDVHTYNAFKVRYDHVLTLLGQIAGEIPGEQGKQAAGMIGMFTMMGGPILNNLTGETYIVQSLERPFSLNSMNALFAMQVRNQDVIAQTMIGLGQQMGLETRDFQGNMIFDHPVGTVSMGLGFDHIFIGSPTDVEDVLRTAAAGGNAQLAQDTRFKDAADLLDDGALAYSYQDLIPTIEWQLWSIHEEELDPYGLEPGVGMSMPIGLFLQEMLAEKDEAFRTRLMDAIPTIDVFKRHLGLSVNQLRATDDGYRGTGYLLRPDNAE